MGRWAPWQQQWPRWRSSTTPSGSSPACPAFGPGCSTRWPSRRPPPSWPGASVSPARRSTTTSGSSSRPGWSSWSRCVSAAGCTERVMRRSAAAFVVDPAVLPAAAGLPGPLPRPARCRAPRSPPPRDTVRDVDPDADGGRRPGPAAAHVHPRDRGGVPAPVRRARVRRCPGGRDGRGRRSGSTTRPGGATAWSPAATPPRIARTPTRPPTRRPRQPTTTDEEPS